MLIAFLAMFVGRMHAHGRTTTTMPLPTTTTPTTPGLPPGACENNGRVYEDGTCIFIECPLLVLTIKDRRKVRQKENSTDVADTAISTTTTIADATAIPTTTDTGAAAYCPSSASVKLRTD